MAQQTVGEVLTFFEGMAAGLFKTIDNIERRLQNLAKKEFKLELQLDDKINKSIQDAIGRVDTQLTRIERKLDEIFNRITSSMRSVQRQASNVSDSLVMKIERDANELATTFWARIVAGSAAVIFATKNIETIMGSVTGTISGLTVIQSIVGTLGKQAVDYFTFVNASAQSIYLWFNASSNILLQMFGTLAKIGTSTALVGAGIFMYQTFLSESVRLVKRIVGLGMTAQTPLERISRIVTTLDVALHSVALTSGQLVKTIAFGVLTITGPFSGIIAGIPFLNSLIDNITNFGARGRSLFLGWLGSGRAQLQAIFLSAKEITFNLLPIVMSSVKAINNVLGFGGLFGTVKKMFGAFLGFGGLTKRITGFFGNVQIFMREIFIVPKIIAGIGDNLYKLFRTADDGVAKLFSLTDFKKIKENLNFAKIQDNLNNLFSFVGAKSSSMQAMLLETLNKITSQVKTSSDEIIKSLKFDQILGKMDEFKKKTEDVTEKVKANTTAVKENQLALVSSALTGGAGQVQQLKVEQTKAATEGQKNYALATRLELLPAVTKQNEEFKTVTGTIIELVRALFEYDTLVQKFSQKQKGGKGGVRLFNMETQTAIKAFITGVVAKLMEGKIKTDELEKRVIRLIEAFKKIPTILLKDIVPSEEFKRRVMEIEKSVILLNASLKKFSETNKIAFDPVKFNKSAAPFLLQFDKIRKDLGIKGNVAGVQFYSALNKSLQKGNDEGKKEFEKLLNILLGFVMSFFPSSPAKRGPLRRLPQAGVKIPLQLSKGMLEGITHVDKAAATIAERIAKYFPRSPVALGALVLLVPSGIKIAAQLAIGMLKGITFVASAAFTIGTTLISTIGKAITGGISFILGKIKGLITGILGGFSSINNFFKRIRFFETAKLADDINFISKQMNLTTLTVSKLDFAMKSVGGSVEDLAFPFRKMNEVLRKIGDSDTFKKFKRFGIDLTEVRKAAKPNEELFLRISEAMEKYPLRKQELLDLINVLAGSTTARLLEQGRSAIEGLGDEAKRSANLIDQEFADLSTNFTRTSNKLKNLFTGVRVEIFNNLMPSINRSLDFVFNAFLENRNKISAFISILVSSATMMAETAASIAVHIFKNPKAAFEELKIIANNFIKLARNLLTDAWNIISTITYGQFNIIWNRLIFLTEDYLPILLDYIKDEMPDFLDKLWDIITGWYDKLIDTLKNRITKFFDFSAESLFKSMPKGVLGEGIGLLDVIGNTAKNVDALSKSTQDLTDIEREMAEGRKMQEDQEKELIAQNKQLERAAKLRELNAKFAEDLKKAVDGAKDTFRDFIPGIKRDAEEAGVETTLLDILTKSAKEQIELWKNFHKEMDERTKKAAEDQAKLAEQEAARINQIFDDLTDAEAAAEKYAFKFADSFADAMGNAWTKFVETGRLSFNDLAGFAEEVFKDSFKNVVEAFKDQFKKGMSSIGEALSETIGIKSEFMDGILSGIMAMAAFLFTRLKGSASVTKDAVKDIAVESAAAMRGVVAGIESIGIMEVSQRLVTGISPLVEEVKSIHTTIRYIADDIHHIRYNKTDLMTAF